MPLKIIILKISLGGEKRREGVFYLFNSEEFLLPRNRLKLSKYSSGNTLFNPYFKASFSKVACQPWKWDENRWRNKAIRLTEYLMTSYFSKNFAKKINIWKQISPCLIQFIKQFQFNLWNKIYELQCVSSTGEFPRQFLHGFLKCNSKYSCSI